MSLTYGFFNALNHDRTYDADQMSSLFNGIIRDGIFESIGTAMVVRPSLDMTVNVGIGRAWFNSKWIDNDALYPITIDESSQVLDRIDTIVIDVNTDVDYRECSLVVVKGTEGVNPVAPTLIDDETHHQHPLADIYISANMTEITDSDITNRVGSDPLTPFVTGILDVLDATELIHQWQSQFNDWNEERRDEFDEWFANIQYVLDGDVAGHLQNEIDAINSHIGDDEDLPLPLNTIAENIQEINTCLGGFKFYLPNTINLVAEVADNDYYTDEDGYYVIADSDTGRALIDNVTYKAYPNSERLYTWGADSAIPFSGGSMIPKELLTYTISTTGSTSCSSYVSQAEGPDNRSFSCQSSNIFTTKTPDGKKAFLYKIETGIHARGTANTSYDKGGYGRANASYVVKNSEGQNVISHSVSASASADPSHETSEQNYNTPIDLIENFVASKFIKIVASGSTSAYGGSWASGLGICTAQASLNTIIAHYVVFK